MKRSSIGQVANLEVLESQQWQIIAPSRDSLLMEAPNGEKAEFCLIDLHKVQKPKWQRKVSDTHVDKIKKDFKVPAAEIVMTNLREDGTEVWVNGQHRGRAVLELGHIKWPGLRWYGLSVEEEIDTYLHMKYMAVRWRDKLLMLLEEEDAVALKLSQIVRDAGYELDIRGGKHGLTCIQMLYDACRTGRHELLRKTLQVSKRAWPSLGNPKGMLLEGIMEFLRVYGEEINEAHLIKRLSEEEPNNLLARASAARSKEGGKVKARWLGREGILSVYNRGLKTKRLGEK